MDTKKKYSSKELFDWLSDKARTDSGMRKKLLGAHQQYTSATVIGKMYFFQYDPKTKDKLPRWDKFPLVFPIERYVDGFLGLNLHYLTPDERERILGQLIKFASAKNMTERTKLKLSYDLINSTKRLNTLARPCVKRYLFTHVRSKFVEIPATEWDRVVQLPLAVFITKG